jgi:hypothetical protein
MRINGKKVINATKPVVLHISERDVASGAVKSPAGCAAALACLRQLKAANARVHLGRTYVEIGDKWVRFQTPQSLRAEIVSFDRGGAFDPGDYTLRVMTPNRIPAGKRQGGKSDNIRPRKPVKIARRSYHVTTGVRSHGANR